MTTKPLRLVLGCDTATREALRRSIAPQVGQVCAETAEFAEIPGIVREQRPDVVLIDLGSPQPGGTDAIRQCRDTSRDVEILVLVAYEFERTVREAWNAGARALVQKNRPDQVALALGALAQRRAYVDPELAAQVLPGILTSTQTATMGGRTPHLTPREREIVQLVAGGRTSKEIAAALSLSPKTIEAHRASILKKLNLRSASQMVLHAVRNNIIQA